MLESYLFYGDIFDIVIFIVVKYMSLTNNQLTTGVQNYEKKDIINCFIAQLFRERNDS